MRTRVRDTSISALWSQVTASQAWGQLAWLSSALGTCRDGVRTHAGSSERSQGRRKPVPSLGPGVKEQARKEGVGAARRGLFPGLCACSC